MGTAWVSIALLGLAGFLLGGVYTLWKTSRAAAGILLALTVLAIGGAVVWYL